MLPFMQIKSFNEMQQNIASVYQDSANDSVQSASDDLRKMANEKFGQKKLSGRYCSFLW